MLGIGLTHGFPTEMLLEESKKKREWVDACVCVCACVYRCVCMHMCVCVRERKCVCVCAYFSRWRGFTAVDATPAVLHKSPATSTPHHKDPIISSFILDPWLGISGVDADERHDAPRKGSSYACESIIKGYSHPSLQNVMPRKLALVQSVIGIFAKSWRARDAAMHPRFFTHLQLWSRSL